MNKEAYKLMVNARSVLIISNPFFGVLVSHLKLVEMYDIPTMATDGKHLFYNPDFTVKDLDEQKRVGVCAHEAYHCAYRHHTRLGDRDLEDWNRAADYVINLDLRQAGFKLPEWVLYDEKYRGRSTEEVYNLIRAEKAKQPKGGGSGDGKGKSGGQSGAGNGKNKQGDQGSKPQGSDAKGNSVDGPGYAPDPGRMGGIVRAAPSWDKTQNSSENSRWEAITRQAVNVAKAQNAGSVPGFLERLVNDLEKPRVSWESVLRQFVDESINRSYTWMSPNRRYLHSGLVLPGTKNDDSIHHTICVMDTSGSITNDLLNKYTAEVRSLLDEGLTEKITVIYADTQVQHVEEFERGDEVKLHPKGGGGTNFRSTFEYIDKNCEDATIILFLTDMITSDFGTDPGKPVLWVVYGDSQFSKTFIDRRPFGEVILVED